MKSILIRPLCMFLMLYTFLFFSCDNNLTGTKQMVQAFKIPELLNRNAKIQNGKEWDDVQSSYQKQKMDLQKNQKDYEAAIRLSQLFIREARVTGEHGHYYPAALKMTQYVLQDSANNDMKFLALVTQAGVQLSLHEFEAALETGQKAIQLNQRNPQIYGVMVDAHVELGKYSEAIEYADMMIALKPDLRSYARISYLREIHGQVSEAIEAMKMAVKAGIPGQEDTAWAMNTLAEMYKMYGDNQKAKATFEEILAMRPHYPFAVGGLSEIALDENNFTLAEAKVNEAIDIIPEVGFYITLAEIYQKTNRKNQADETIKEIFAMLQDDQDSGHNMNLEYANVYLNLQNDPDMALKYALAEYNKRPKNIDVNRIMAKIYMAKNDVEKTKEHTKIAQSTQSKHPEIIDLIAHI
ncbi:MAG: tetratricopeptide repeat protein [Saprospiraceae bacterium]